MNIIRVALFAVTVHLFTALAVADTGTTEHQIKAAYLYKFASYVEWPPTVFAQINAPFTIGIIGAEDVGMALNELKIGHAINNRSIDVKILKPGDPLTNVQMLYVGEQEAAQLQSLLKPAEAQPVLVVTDSANALTMGSIINFLMVEERVRFEVSVSHAERNGLKISARLLAVAQNIETGAKE